MACGSSEQNEDTTNTDDIDSNAAADSIDNDEREDTEETEDTGTAFIDLTALSSTMVYAEIYNMMRNPESYNGKQIKMEGEYMKFNTAETDIIYNACIIYDALACCAQGMEFILNEEAVYPDDYPTETEIITVVGTFETYEENGYVYCHLVDATWE